MQAQNSRKWREDDPRRLRMAETRAAILRAARPIMLRDGLGGTTLDRVAAEGGIAKMTLYRHFPSKEALFEGLVTATCESMREGLENAPTADTDKPIANRLADELQRLHLGAHRAGRAGALSFDRGGRLAFSGTCSRFRTVRHARYSATNSRIAGNWRSARRSVEASRGRGRGIGAGGCVSARNSWHCRRERWRGVCTANRRCGKIQQF